MSKLFSPMMLGSVELSNRIVVSPMCQYSAVDGCVTDWHMAHLGGLALSGAGILTIEATAVSRAGRITPGCVGLYSDRNEEALSKLLALIHAVSPIKVALQINHSGRKGSTNVPWITPVGLSSDAGGWRTLAPSAVPFADGWQTPKAASETDLKNVVSQFVASAERASRLDIDVLEIHMSHGYLLNEFLSPLVNVRDDAYGGSLQNRMRFCLEIFEAVQKNWPKPRALGAKIPGSDYADGGWDADDAAALARELKARGADYVMVSGGGNVSHQKPPLEPAMNASFSKVVKENAGIKTGTVGMIATGRVAEDVIASGKADFLAVARGFLSDPRWAVHAAAELGVDPKIPHQYDRATPANWPPAQRTVAA
jgi:2,4-dienoyl-CoA reductase-like NADH-dependent reductase (Old Yellow Enzyme family)